MPEKELRSTHLYGTSLVTVLGLPHSPDSPVERRKLEVKVDIGVCINFWSTKFHRGQEQDGGLTNYTKRSDTVRVAGATPLTTPHVWTNHRIWVF